MFIARTEKEELEYKGFSQFVENANLCENTTNTPTSHTYLHKSGNDAKKLCQHNSS